MQTLRIAERCNIEMPFEGNLLPRYQVPDGFTLDTYLKQVARIGLQEPCAGVQWRRRTRTGSARAGAGHHLPLAILDTS